MADNSLDQSLLQRLRKTHIESVIWETYLRNPALQDENSKNRYSLPKYPVEFLYVTDVYDISGACFPLGFKSFKKDTSKINIDIVVDEQVAWTNFFDNKSHKLFLLDEHRNELRSLIGLVGTNYEYERVDFWQELNNLFSKLRGKTINLEVYKNLIEKLEIIENDLLTITSFALGFSGNKLKQFNDIINSLLIDTEDLDGKFSNHEIEHITRAFDISIPKKFSQILFEDQLKSIKSTVVAPTDRRLNSLLSDCLIVDRLLQLNEYFSDINIINTLGKQFVFLFMSSSKRTQSNFTTSPLIYEKLPLVGRNKFNIFRSNAHYYLDLLTENQTTTEKILQLKDFLKSSVETDKSDIDEHLTNKLNGLRTQAEFFSVVKHKDDYAERFKDGFNKLKLYFDTDSLYELSNELAEKIDELEINKTYKESLATTRNLNIAHSLFEIINIIFKNPRISILPYRSPEDYLIGINHVFPTVFKYSPGNSSRKIMNDLISVIFSFQFSNLHQDHLRTYFQNNFLNKTNYIDGSDDDILVKQYEDRLIFYYIILIIYPFPFQEKLNQSEREIINKERIKEQLLRHLTSDIEAINMITNSQSSDLYKDLQKNYYYFYIWVLRYFGMFNKAVNIAEIAIELFNQNKDIGSPRFYHGLGLAYYCILKENLSKVAKPTIPPNFKKNIEDTLSAFEAAKLRYENGNSLKKDVYGVIQLTENNMIANPASLSYGSLLNSYLYVNLLKHEYNLEDKHSLEFLRSILEKIRTIQPFSNHSNNIKWKDFPEHLFVEAFLEYFEARSLYFKYISSPILGTQKKIITIKINHAHDAISSAQRIEKQRFSDNNTDADSKTTKMFNDLFENIDTLRSQINRMSLSDK